MCRKLVREQPRSASLSKMTSGTGTDGFERWQRHTNAGFNVGYLDGHVEWVPGKDVKRRFSTPGLTLFW